MEITGTIKQIEETKTYGENNYKKRGLVITTQEQYPQTLLIEFIKDKCDVLNTFKAGQPVTIGINLRGREWKSPQGDTKYFNSLQGWKINLLNDLPTVTVSEHLSSREEEDGLPF